MRFPSVMSGHRFGIGPPDSLLWRWQLSQEYGPRTGSPGHSVLGPPLSVLGPVTQDSTKSC